MFSRHVANEFLDKYGLSDTRSTKAPATSPFRRPSPLSWLTRRVSMRLPEATAAALLASTLLAAATPSRAIR